jgi:hypothetical protein
MSNILFNPTNTLQVVDQNDFTGTAFIAGNFVAARVSFIFSDLDPSPLPESFQITNISLKGDGITSSISFNPRTITGNGTFHSNTVNIDTPTNSFNYSNSLISFDLPAGIINNGATFLVRLQYRDEDSEFVITSASGPIFEADTEFGGGNGGGGGGEEGSSATLKIAAGATVKFQGKVKVA